MNINKMFGIGVWVMLFKHPLKQALADQRAAIDRLDGHMRKLASVAAEMPTLAKSASVESFLKQENQALRKILALQADRDAALADVLAASDRMHAALPAFEAWATSCATVDRRFYTVEKSVDSSGADAKRSPLAVRQPPNAPKVDHAAAWLAHNQRRGED